MTGKLKFGQRVGYSKVLVRREGRPKIGDAAEWRHFWKREHTRKTIGIVIGFRTLTNGHTDIGGNYSGDEHFPAYIVASSLYRNPVRVKPEDLTIIEEQMR